MSWKNIQCHPSVKRAVMQSSQNGMLHQTTIVYGPPGAGQEAVALAIAKTIACMEIEHDFCGVCKTCMQIDEGERKYPDVIEMRPAKSTYAVEQIRDMQSNAVIHPFTGDFKVFLLHESHRMNAESFNCLLKTLEEPYPHTVFILTTNTISAILPTIMSRCRKLRIPPQPIEELTQQLGANYPSVQAEALARFSGGLVGQAEYWIEEDFFSQRDEIYHQLQALLKNEAAVFGFVNAMQSTTGKKKEIHRQIILNRINILMSFLRDAVSFSSGSSNPVYIHTDLADQYPQVFRDIPAEHWISCFEKTLDVIDGMNRHLNLNAQLTELLIHIRNPQTLYV